MFNKEDGYARQKRKSIEKSRESINLNEQKHWPVNRSGARRVWLPNRALFAQNEMYLELCNFGWDIQWRTGMAVPGVLFFGLFIIWLWYGFAIHPILFEKIIIVYEVGDRVPSVAIWVGWLLFFPMAIVTAFMIFAVFYYMGGRTCFFTYARGRIRFNRLTRKVYVLRPGYCGGNQVFEWERLVALFEPDKKPELLELKGLTIYHPPFDPDDPEAKGEDCLFVGPTLADADSARYVWEYIRQYMEVGPTVDRIPKDAPDTYKGIARYLHPDYFTYCGLPSWMQYGMETGGGFFQTLDHMITQITCRWARFPKEWQSDSGLGEPEDRPVQTGAVMTAMVYRAKGKLSKEDEIEFLTHWGTEEALAEARERE